MNILKIYIGYDSREEDAFKVCQYSIKKHASIPVQIIPLKQKDLRISGIYTRNNDSLSSTEFSFTRFLIPYLSNYSGASIFCDCDFVWTTDISELLHCYDSNFAVQVVKKAYVADNTVKMNGHVQTNYERKNWSSMILWNCGHKSNLSLTPEIVNNESGLYLHQFKWLNDGEIGSLDKSWNHLVDVDGPIHLPKAIHYTNGGPWFENYKNCGYADVWLSYYNEMISI